MLLLLRLTVGLILMTKAKERQTLKQGVGRNGKTYELGYKLHVAVDAKSELPLTVVAAPANDNEKKHAPTLFEKALRSTHKRMKLLVADSQYSCQGQRTQASNSGV